MEYWHDIYFQHLQPNNMQGSENEGKYFLFFGVKFLSFKSRGVEILPSSKSFVVNLLTPKSD